MAKDKTIYWLAGKPKSRNRHDAKIRQLAHYLHNLAWLISLTFEAEPGAWEDRYRSARNPDHYQAGYRLERLPARFARVIRKPRQRHYDLESAYITEVTRLAAWEGPIREIASSVDARESDTAFEDLDKILQLYTGQTLEQVARGFPELMGQLSTTQPPSAAQLPYRPADLPGDTLVHFFIRDRNSGMPEAEASRRVGDIAAGGGGYEHLSLADPYGIGRLTEMLATTRADDGSELGLAHRYAPSSGWLDWYRQILERARHGLEQIHAGLNLSVPMVTEPDGTLPADPPGLADSRYRYAARFVAAWEGAPITDTQQHPSLESYRFERAHIGITDDAWYLLRQQVRRVLGDTRRDPRRLEGVLGRATAGAGRDLGEALAGAMSWYVPARHYSLWGAVGLGSLGGPPGSPAELQVLPMNRWEIRFRFPELTDLFSRLAPGSGSGGLGAAVGSFIADREPCRVWLPPSVGELHELVSLLPADRDLGYAAAHLGAGSSGGTAWRDGLLQAAAAITAHIWDHEDQHVA